MHATRRLRVSRRNFLLFSGLTTLPAFWSPAMAVEGDADAALPSRLFRRAPPPLTAADQVLNLMDFEALARDALPPAHFGYIATGADEDRTVIRNHEAFSRYAIKAHRFNDVSHLDTKLTLLGTSASSPIYLSAVSSMRAFHADGEIAVARAARTRSALLMLSNGSSMATEQVMQERGAPIWQQLYATDDWAVTTGIVRRAEKLGCTAIAVTLDSRGARNNETLRRAMQVDNRDCTSCHANNSHDMWHRAPMFTGLDVSRVTALSPPDQSLAFFDRLRALVKVRLIAKGIVSGEDAALAVEHGADAIIVSNHGGRNEETLRASVECLPEVVAAVRGRVPVLLDGGIRRGTDVFKALALGASAVGIGRPQAWGLAAFGQPGVEAVLDILNRELAAIMRQAGTPTLSSITRAHVVDA
jgi:4-hydroxymandelate oxidase